MSETTQPKNVVVTVVMTQGENGLVPSHNVLVDGQQVEAQVGLILVGPLQLLTTSGVTTTDQMRQMVSQANGLSTKMNDLLISTLLAALLGHNHKDAPTEAEEPTSAPPAQEALTA